MAKSNGDAGKPGKGAGIMGVIVKVCFGVGLVAVIVLFLAAVDFGVFDLRSALAMPALGALVLLVVCAGLGGLGSRRASGALANGIKGEMQAHSETLLTRMAEVEASVNSHLGEETARLKTENEDMRAELDRIRQDEEDRLKQEFEELKQRNLELQQQLQNTSQAMNAAAPAAGSAPGTGEQGEAA